LAARLPPALRARHKRYRTISSSDVSFSRRAARAATAPTEKGRSGRSWPAEIWPKTLPSKAQTDQPSENPPPKQSTTDGEGGAGTHRPLPYQFGWQATVITQSLFPFHNPYIGPNSFRPRAQTEVTDTYTLFLGTRLTRNSEVYLNPEWALGQGVGGGAGLGGYTNGDLIGPAGLRTDPYIARLLPVHE
jgi:hypothetical protein